MLLLAAACSGGEKALSPEQRVAVLEVTPESPRLVIPSQTTMRLNVRVADASGVPVPGVTPVWSVSNSTVVSVSPGDGFATLTAVAPGLATVTVSAGRAVATVQAEVVLAPVFQVIVSLPAGVLGIGENTTASARSYDSFGSLLSGRTPLWSSSDPAIASVSPAGVVTGVGVGAATITATVEGVSASAAVTIVGSPPNLSIQNVMLTQTVQRADGGIPLVAGGNPVLVSVFATLDRPFIGGPAPRVRIVAYKGATQVLTDERQMTGSPGPSWDNGSPIHQVVLPSSIAEPGLRLLVTINPDGVPGEATLTDNTWPPSGQPRDIVVRSIPSLPIHFVPIFLSAGGSTGTVSDNTLAEYLFATRQLHPVAEVDATIGGVFSTDVNFGDGQASAWIAILQQLDVVRVAEGSNRYYVGALRPPAGVTFVQYGGFGYIPSDPQSIGSSTRTAVLVGVGWFNRARHTTELVAHELGHTMGRRHAPCGGAAGPDPLYPYGGASIGAYGYDLYSYSLSPGSLPTAFGPFAATDIMSYCTPAWISDYNYEALMNVRAGAAAGVATAAPGAECDCLIIWGSVEGDSVRLQPSFTLRTRVALPVNRGPVSVTGETRDGRQLFFHEFEAAELDHAPGVRHFALAIPLAEADRMTLERITARYRGRGAVMVSRGLAGGQPGPLEARAGVVTRRLAADVVEVRWDPRTAPVVVARDPETGRILGLATGGRMVLRTSRAEVELSLSDGVRSAATRVRPDRR